jgi:hypothetical protein
MVPGVFRRVLPKKCPRVAMNHGPIVCVDRLIVCFARAKPKPSAKALWAMRGPKAHLERSRLTNPAEGENMKKIIPHAMAPFAVILALALNAPLIGCAAQGTSESTGQYVDDATISTKVRTAILADKDVKITEVKVTTYRGTVQLSGFVDDAQMVTKAGEDARQVAGVKAVKNDLVVRR